MNNNNNNTETSQTNLEENANSLSLFQKLVKPVR